MTLFRLCCCTHTHTSNLISCPSIHVLLLLLLLLPQEAVGSSPLLDIFIFICVCRKQQDRLPV